MIVICFQMILIYFQLIVILIFKIVRIILYEDSILDFYGLSRQIKWDKEQEHI